MDVIGYENYLIYPDGKVTSKRFPKRYLKGRLNRHGYLQVNLYKDNKSNNKDIHRLVAEHYIPNHDNKPQVDHINRDKKDNRVENLRWVSNGENQQNTGLRKDNKTGIKNIVTHQSGYRYVKRINNVIHKKYFKTLEDAIAYKEEYEKLF
jgi:hypothetical protein